MIEGMRVFGATEEQIAEERAKAAPPPAQPVAIWPDNETSWMFFLLHQTQWAYVSDGMNVMRAGLRYEAVEASMRMRGTPRAQRAGLFEDLQLIEASVLTADRERRAAEN